MKRAAPALVLTLAFLGAAPLEAQPAATDPSGARNYSSAGLYNLANSYAREGRAGMAVLYYERANLLSPYDSDIDANLNHVLKAVNLPARQRGTFNRLARMMTPFAASWLGLLGLIIVGAATLAWTLSFGCLWCRRVAAFLGVGMICFTVCNGAAVWPTLHEGIVISAATPVRVAPVPMGDALLTLPEADSVKIIAAHEEFLLIRTAGGRIGWVSRANVVPVVPRT